MMLADAVSSVDGIEALIYADAVNPLAADADFSKPTATSYDKQAYYSCSNHQSVADDVGLTKRRMGWATPETPRKSRPSSASSFGRIAASASERRHHTNGEPRILCPGDKTMPSFLTSALAFLKDELKAVGAERVHCGDPRRLQVYSQVFDAFISEFKTYRTLLTDVKHEYDTALRLQQEAIETYRPMEAELAVHKYKADQDLRRARAEGQRLLDAKTAEFNKLQQQHAKTEGDLESLRYQYNKVTGEVALRDARNEEYTSTKLADVRTEMQNLEREKNKELQLKDEELADLQGGLRKAHEDLSSLMDAMNALKEEYSDSVTRKDYEAKCVELDCVNAELAERNRELEASIVDRQHLEGHITSLERSLKREQEPKQPDWDYVQRQLPQSINEWGLLCRGLNHDDTVVLLLRELIKLRAGAPKGSKQEPQSPIETLDTEPRFFIGLGISAAVPKHLRFKGKIRNRKLSKKNLCLLIRDIWAAKAVHDATPRRVNRKFTLADFLHAYLKKRFGAQEVIAEWGYNIHEACKKYKFHNVECLLFHDILTGELDESVYHHQSLTIEQLKNAFYRADVEMHEGRAMGMMTKDAAMDVLRNFWKTKEEKELQQLRNAIDADQSGNMLTYRWLFQNDIECLFLDIVREQEIEAREAYLAGLADVLGSSVRLEANSLRRAIASTTTSFQLTPSDFARGISRFDPTKPKLDVDTLIERGFGVKTNQLKLKKSMDVDLFMSNIRRGVLQMGPIQVV
ncbi:hypothetical protein BC832DRAFT_590551 [Gaertneriomyces semiglobifer]|nr:hypothetical protein BC832DRAFT_590551 [Gaertneriomyces semiglobifer]